MPLIYHEGYSLGDSDGAGTYQLVKDTVGWTGKNLLKNTASSQTKNGITFTVNSDGTITANGTATANTSFYLAEINSSKFPTSIIVSSGVANDNAYIFANAMNGSSFVRQLGNTRQSKEFSLNLDYSDYTHANLEIWIVNGTTVNNLTFYPMLRRADILDDTYEPYHESVETMYEEEIHGVNLLPIIASSQTINGVTFTVNADGSVKANGTATSNGAELKLYTFGINDTVVGKKLILSGCPTGGGATTYRLMGFRVADASGVSGTIFETGEGETFDYLNNIGTGYISLQIRPNYTANNLVFKPMLRKADIEDSTYRPYNHQAIQNQLNAQGVLGAKNLLENTASTTTVNGVTFTVNADKSVTVNGTATADATIKITPNSSLRSNLKEGISYILSGCPGGGSSSTYALQYSNNTNNVKYDTGSGVEFVDYDRGTYPNVSVYILIRSGVTASNLTFKPMIRLASDPDDTYQPYAMTNRELTEKKIDAELTFVTGVSVDTLTENKRYYCSGGMTGLPTGNIGYLDVHRNPDRNAVHQIFYPAGAQGEIYVRRFWDNAWGSWYKFTGTVVS